jgi:3-deoxy-manno-octulosonate cytidylyltransferase (CMP-KDO synthetase)
MASTRFPGKPLVDIGGIAMVMRVYNQSKKCEALSAVVVATDNLEILNHVIESGGEAIMTNERHETGTSRCEEVSILFPHYDAYINIQGDEPFISPNQILKVANLLKNGAAIATLAKPDSNKEHLLASSVVKVVLNHKNEALLFSRALIPFVRDPKPDITYSYLRHIGIYGFQKKILEHISNLSSPDLEKYENLEQLRWLYNGFSIQVDFTNEESFSIDTPEDLVRVKQHFNIG